MGDRDPVGGARPYWEKKMTGSMYLGTYIGDSIGTPRGLHRKFGPLRLIAL